MARNTVDNLLLDRWRRLPALHVLPLVADHAKQDPSFQPLKALDTTRWHLSAGGTDFELLCTGPKFFDTRSRIGGAGAIDLVCHLWRVGFKDAVQMLLNKKV